MNPQHYTYNYTNRATYLNYVFNFMFPARRPTFCRSCPHNTKGLSNAVIHWQPSKGRQTAVTHVGSRSLQLSLWRLFKYCSWSETSFLRQPLRHSKDETTKDPIPDNTSPHYQVALPYGASTFLPLMYYAHKHKTISHPLPTNLNQPKTHARVQDINDELVWVTDLQFSRCHTN
jgi:hypothetical protein